MLEYDPANVEFDKRKRGINVRGKANEKDLLLLSNSILTEDVFLASLASGLLVGYPWAGVDCCFPADENGQDDESMSKRLVSPSRGKGS